MALDVYFREDIQNALRSAVIAHGPMGDEAARLVTAIAANFGISSDKLEIAVIVSAGVSYFVAECDPLVRVLRRGER